MNERFKELRSFLNLSQEQMGEAIGLSKSGISNIESGARNVTEKHIKLLSITFNVNEDWLRLGNGQMFAENDDTLIANLAREYNMSNAQQRIIRTFLNMDDAKREAVSQAFFAFVDALASEPKPTAPPTTPSPPPIITNEELQRRQAIIAAEYESEKKGEMLSAFIGSNGHAKRA